MLRNAFGQLVSPPYLRFAGEGGDGGGKEFTPPASQEDLDKIVNSRLDRERKKFDGFDDFKAKAEKWDAHEAASKPKDEPKPKDDEGKPSGVSGDDVDKRISDALAAERKELALERVADQLDKALEGRTFSASKMFSLDRSQFIAADGKSVDAAKLADWVKENTEEGAAPTRRLRGQGERDSHASGGSVQAGKDLYDQKKPSRKD